jgi:hypothetical protein
LPWWMKSPSRCPPRSDAMRRLYVTKAGYWYIFLTIAIGVVALTTANNVFYLMECLLLGGMILSGVVSERTISSVDVTWIRKQATAGVTVRDVLLVDSLHFFLFGVRRVERRTV